MRISVQLICFLCLTTLLSCRDSSSDVSRTAITPANYEDRILGTWKSKNLGLDFPIWMTNTYNSDGTVIIEFYAQPQATIVHHKENSDTKRWQIVDEMLEVGEISADGSFKRDGVPRSLIISNTGELLGIDSWRRDEDPPQPST